MTPFETKRARFSELADLISSVHKPAMRYLEEEDKNEEERISFVKFYEARAAQDRLVTSLHEAAHAAMFEARGCRVSSVTIKEIEHRKADLITLNGAVSFKVVSASKRDLLICVAAGPVIEKLFRGRLPDENFADSDMFWLRQGTSNDAELLQCILEEARREVFERATSIERVSDALLCHETLSGEDLRAVLREAA